MPAISARAPAKAILFGEHAVVYGRPAIAVPLTQVQARVTILAEPLAPSGRIWIEAPDTGLNSALSDLPEDHPLQILVRSLTQALVINHLPALCLRINSTIPVAAGLGSGAAVSVAALRAMSGFLGHLLDDEQVNTLAFQVEKAYHGTPSGIDNTVVTYARPIYFVRERPFELLKVAAPFTLVIGDSGIPSPTASAVAGVRARWQAKPRPYEALFDEVAAVVNAARQVIETGAPEKLGPLMDENHRLLQKIGVSSPELDRLVEAAKQAGAWGAKLSGGGQGGNMLALAAPEQAVTIAAALTQAGAVRTIVSVVQMPLQ